MSNNLFSTHISLPYKQSACSDILRELSQMSERQDYDKDMAMLFKDEGGGLLRLVAKDIVAVKSATRRQSFFGKNSNGIWIL